MAEYELVYFPARGRGETSRMIFAEAGVEFKDTRIAGPQWAEKKPSTPFGQIPVLYVTKDGKTTAINDSFAISTYLGQTLGVKAATPELEAVANGAALALADSLTNLLKAKFGPEEGREAALKTYLETDLPRYAGQLEALIASRGGPYLTGEQFAWQDIAIANLFGDVVKGLPGADDILKPYVHINKLVEATFARPNIAKWIASRPE